jgi:hypothetical protein
MPWTERDDPFEPRRQQGEAAGRPRLRFHVYSVGEFHGACCTSLTDSLTVAQMNLEHPSEIGPWRMSEQPFSDGTPNGTACPDVDENGNQLLPGCRHVMLVRGKGAKVTQTGRPR